MPRKANAKANPKANGDLTAEATDKTVQGEELPSTSIAAGLDGPVKKAVEKGKKAAASKATTAKKANKKGIKETNDVAEQEAVEPNDLEEVPAKPKPAAKAAKGKGRGKEVIKENNIAEENNDDKEEENVQIKAPVRGRNNKKEAVVVNEETDGVPIKKKRNAKKPLQTKDDGENEEDEAEKQTNELSDENITAEVTNNEEEVLKKPVGRGRKKVPPTALDEIKEKPTKTKQAKKQDVPKTDEMEVNETEIDSNEGPVSKKPAARGRKKKEEEMPVVGENNVETLDNETVPKGRKRKGVTETSTSKPVSESKKPKRNAAGGAGGGRKKAANIAEPEESEEVDAEPAAVPLKAAGRKKGAAPKTSQEDTDVVAPVETKAKPARGKKRAAATMEENENENEDEIEDKDENKASSASPVTKQKAKAAKTKAAKKPVVKKDKPEKLLNSIDTEYNKNDFDFVKRDEDTSSFSDGKPFNLKISSWNVAGLRSWLKKDGLKFLEYEQPDIFCIQETKCATDQLPDEARIPGYHPYWLCMPGGYAGVAVYSKIMPINVEYGIGSSEFDVHGRMITAEYEKFYLINVYVPNSGRGLVNLEARMRWEKLFQEYVKKLDAIKPLIICGDMNCSHNEIDLANPKANTRNAGFTKEEREKFSELLALGFVDTFRHFYPNKTGAYTYWTYMANARSRNVGWRLDYFLVSERFVKRIANNNIRAQVKGSDHCPITLFLSI